MAYTNAALLAIHERLSVEARGLLYVFGVCCCSWYAFQYMPLIGF